MIFVEEWRQIWVNGFLSGSRLCCERSYETNNYTTIVLSMQAGISGISRVAFLLRIVNSSVAIFAGIRKMKDRLRAWLPYLDENVNFTHF